MIGICIKRYIFNIIFFVNILFSAEAIELKWDQLIPSGYKPEEIFAKYNNKLSLMSDISPKAQSLYNKMVREMNSAPPVKKLNNVIVKIEGFVTPMEYQNGMISEFLLVPYFGACIHVPPPPINNTVFVKVKGKGIEIEDSHNIVAVTGKITLDIQITKLADAGYSIIDADVEIMNKKY